MKPGRSSSLMREISTVVPDSKSVSRPDWELEPHQTPITQPEPGPEKTRTAQPASKAQQRPSTQQESASQQRPLTQQEPLAPNEAESQQEPGAQLKSASQQERLASQEPAPQQSPPFAQQEAASQQGPGSGKGSGIQQEPEMGEGRTEPPLDQQEVGSTPLDQTESGYQENPGQSDPIAQQTAPAKFQQSSLIEWEFLSKLHELSIQQQASEWKTFLEWVTDLDSESDSGCSSENDSPAVSGGTVAQGMKLAFKWKPDYEVMSECGGTSAHGKKTSSQSHRRYQDPGELSLEEWGREVLRAASMSGVRLAQVTSTARQRSKSPV